jgi:hypothetical protein
MAPSTFEKNSVQSQVIDLLRFPLALMVILLHCETDTYALNEAPFPLLSADGILNLLRIIFTVSAPRIAVQTFLFISGYLFFVNFAKWDWKLYLRKIKSRVRTLVVPYFAWNLIYLLAILLILFRLVYLRDRQDASDLIHYYLFDANWHIFYDIMSWHCEFVNWIGTSLRVDAPINGVLWFVRDLFVLSLLSPLIYAFIKRLKIYGLLVLLMAYLSQIFINVPGFTIVSLFPFAFGAYFAINRLNILDFVQRYRYVIFCGAIIFLIPFTYYNGLKTQTGHTIGQFYYFFGAFATFYIAKQLVEKHGVKPNKLLTTSVFTMYALQRVGDVFSPLNLPQRVVHWLIPNNPTLEGYVALIVVPIGCVAMCVAAYWVMHRYLPFLCRILNPERR